MDRPGTTRGQDASGVHLWLVFMKAFQALVPHAAGSIEQTKLGDSEFRVLEVLLHKGPLPVNIIGPKVWLTPGSICVAIDRLKTKALVKGKATYDRRVRCCGFSRSWVKARMLNPNTPAYARSFG